MLCVFHIGSHKTGTSALQSLLHDAAGGGTGPAFIYPRCCVWGDDRSHNRLGIHFWDDYRPERHGGGFAELLADLLTEAAGAAMLVISTELAEKAALYRHPNLMRFLAALRGAGYRIRVVYTLRRRDRLFDSIAKQRIRDANARYHDDPRALAETEAPFMSFARTAAAWCDLGFIDDIALVPYVEGDHRATLRGVLGAMGLAALLPDTAAIRVENPSLDGRFLPLVHWLNRYPMSGAMHNRLVDACFAAAAAAPVPSARQTFFTPVGRARYLAMFRRDDEALRQRHAFAWPADGPGPDDAEVFAPLAPAGVGAMLRELEPFDPALRALFRWLPHPGPHRLAARDDRARAA